MKKLLLLLSLIPLMMAACTSNGDKPAADTTALTTAAKSHLNSLNALPELITLNGVPLATADTFVSNFINKPSVYKSPTSIWFSKAYVDSLKALLYKEGADGFRIYFATYPNGHNVIITSTRETGVPDTHQDYFEHSSKFLKTADARGVVDYTGRKGATLYDPALKCPGTDNCNATYTHYLKCDEAAARVKNFTNDKFLTTSEWFDIEVLDNLSKELNGNSSADGIRIYYARNTNPTKNTHGFVITTTKPSGTNSSTHDDYYTCTTKFRDLDNGEQCPNNCNGVTWPKP
ncbi:hypothetical protein EWM62_13660 [Mucilaginibacter terrigena]|uniref:Lipoprotein n=1 Tax=Mucilaginibacter terrigena TaxID=2492395 RepID=A0A4Q5LIY0_9SPHI|nr:hypothetical protein [Mucilaginibacter terrigena]RYU89371.1 hypothetical protein EWM62_13660 [Mucilaginibacter terrigena]